MLSFVRTSSAAPTSKSHFATSRCPLKQAKSIGVLSLLLFLVRIPSAAPTFKSHFATSIFPFKQASRIEVLSLISFVRTSHPQQHLPRKATSPRRDAHDSKPGSAHGSVLFLCPLSERPQQHHFKEPLCHVEMPMLVSREHGKPFDPIARLSTPYS